MEDPGEETPPPQLTRANIILMNNELSGNERHFNTLQANYRMMAAGWLAAAFTGIGFVLEKNTTVGPLQPLFVNGVIALMGCAGILLAWILDLRVYHALLDACFISGLKLEQEHKWLPQQRSNMIRLTGNATKNVIWFYLTGFILLSVTAAAFFSMRVYQGQPGGNLFTSLLTGAIFLVCIVVICLAMKKATVKNQQRFRGLADKQGIKL